jgi:hypothetical protein
MSIPCHYCTYGPSVFSTFGARMRFPDRRPPDPPCLPGRILPSGLAPLLPPLSLGLPFRPFFANRPANRLRRRFSRCDILSPTAASRRHFPAVFGHLFASWRAVSLIRPSRRHTVGCMAYAAVMSLLLVTDLTMFLIVSVSSIGNMTTVFAGPAPKLSIV